MILQTKIVIALVSLTVVGAGAGVAYHDGAFARNLEDLTMDDLNQEVTVRGTVAAKGEVGWANDMQADHGAGRVGYFVIHNEDKTAWFAVTTNDELPEDGETVVITGTLKYFIDVGAYAGGYTHNGHKHDMDMGGWAAGAGKGGWIDSAGIRVSWTF